MHVRLQPGLRRVWRGPGTVQIGLNPSRGTVLDGLTADDAGFVDRLAAGVDVDAPGTGPAVTRSDELVGLLAASGLLVTRPSGRGVLSRLGGARSRLAGDAAAWGLVRCDAGDGWDTVARRSRCRVEVRGAGRTAAVLATTLAAQGVDVAVTTRGGVTASEVCPAGAGGDDVGRPRDQVLAERVAAARSLPPARGRPGRSPARTPTVDLVVLVEHGAADAAAAQPLLDAGATHLSVVVREADVVVGPLVRRGCGPCLHCLDLHRSDRDPRWPLVLAQLLSPAAERPEEAAEEVALATLAGAVAALQVVAALDGDPAPATAGATLELELPDGLPSRRPWPVHPACACWGPA